MPRLCACCLFALCAAVVLCGCAKKPYDGPEFGPPPEKNYEAELPPGQPALRKVTDPAKVPDFTAAFVQTAGLRQAIDLSLSYLSKRSSQAYYPCGAITHEQAVASLRAFAALLDARLSPVELNQAVRERFDVYISVGCDAQNTVLFTGYYTPLLEASPVRTERFRFPLYKPPANLVKLPDGSPATPMPDRRAIESGGLYAGQELYWLADPFEPYVAHVQGSARLRLPDGREVTVGYAANNGHAYESIRPALVADGKIGKRDGLGPMMSYFRSRPGEVSEYTWRNPRFVFFAEVADGRPRGCLNEPVTPWRSIATDKRIFPPACLAFISARLPQPGGSGVVEAPYAGFALDQDAGGAIRAPGRCDLYMGTGNQAADLAGRTQNEGQLYYLFLKPPAPPGTVIGPAVAP